MSVNTTCARLELEEALVLLHAPPPPAATAVQPRIVTFDSATLGFSSFRFRCIRPCFRSCFQCCWHTCTPGVTKNHQGELALCACVSRASAVH